MLTCQCCCCCFALWVFSSVVTTNSNHQAGFRQRYRVGLAFGVCIRKGLIDSPIMTFISTIGRFLRWIDYRLISRLPVATETIGISTGTGLAGGPPGPPGAQAADRTRDTYVAVESSNRDATTPAALKKCQTFNFSTLLCSYSFSMGFACRRPWHPLFKCLAWAT